MTLFPLTKSHTDSGTPSHCILPGHWLPCMAFPRSRATSLPPLRAPSACFLQHECDLFSPSAVSGSSCRHGRTVRGRFQKRFSPNSLAERFFSGLGDTPIATADSGSDFAPTPLALLCQEVSFSVTSTVYLGVQPEGHSLLQVFSSPLSPFIYFIKD